jgi:hypothetical protein
MLNHCYGSAWDVALLELSRDQLIEERGDGLVTWRAGEGLALAGNSFDETLPEQEHQYCCRWQTLNNEHFLVSAPVDNHNYVVAMGELMAGT